MARSVAVELSWQRLAIRRLTPRLAVASALVIVVAIPYAHTIK
jgi:hypothetical protein